MRMKGYQKEQNELSPAEPDCARDEMASAETVDAPSDDEVAPDARLDAGPTLALLNGGADA